MVKKSTSQEPLNGERGTMNEETIVTSAFRVYCSEFSCSLAPAALDDLFEHLARSLALVSDSLNPCHSGVLKRFF